MDCCAVLKLWTLWDYLFDNFWIFFPLRGTFCHFCWSRWMDCFFSLKRLVGSKKKQKTKNKFALPYGTIYKHVPLVYWLLRTLVLKMGNITIVNVCLLKTKTKKAVKKMHKEIVDNIRLLLYLISEITAG